MTDTSSYTPPEVWKWDTESGGKFASINRPVAGATHEKELPVGEHSLQLYSLATPNGVKVTVLLEELLELGKSDAEYDAYLVNISDGDQFGSGFVGLNPNSKIPALQDLSTSPPTRVFESGAILVYLAEKFDAFIPKEPSARAECMSWLFWQMGSAPYLGGGFGHFYAYAPEKMEYLALIWGSLLMAATGFVLWFNNLTMRWLPGWASDVSTTIHFYEAILATGAIVVWHFYFVIFDPVVYPMDTTWLTGQSPVARVKEREGYSLDPEADEEPSEGTPESGSDEEKRADAP